MEFYESLMHLSDSERDDLIRQLDKLKKVLVVKSPEKKFPSPTKNQKTLDGWVIKRSDASKQPADQPSSNEASRSNLDKVSESRKSSEEINSEDLALGNYGSYDENSVISSSSRLIEKSLSINDLPLSAAKEATTNNAFSKKCASRFKRKVSHTSRGFKQERTSKRIKSSTKLNHMHSNEGDQIESDKSTNINCSLESESVEKNIADNNLSVKKNTYNLRTKAKSRFCQNCDEPHKLTTENNHTDINTKNIDGRSKKILLDPKREAFCKFNEICKNMGLNALEILTNKKIESLLNNPEMLCNDAIFFIGSLQLNSGKTSPIVHVAKSKKKLLDSLMSVKQKLPNHELI